MKHKKAHQLRDQERYDDPAQDHDEVDLCAELHVADEQDPQLQEASDRDRRDPGIGHGQVADKTHRDDRRRAE